MVGRMSAKPFSLPALTVIKCANQFTIRNISSSINENVLNNSDGCDS